MVLFLAWFVLSQAPRNVWISLVFLIVGLFIVMLSNAYFHSSAVLLGALYWAFTVNTNSVFVFLRRFRGDHRFIRFDPAP